MIVIWLNAIARRSVLMSTARLTCSLAGGDKTWMSRVEKLSVDRFFARWQFFRGTVFQNYFSQEWQQNLNFKNNWWLKDKFGSNVTISSRKFKIGWILIHVIGENWEYKHTIWMLAIENLRIIRKILTDCVEQYLSNFAFIFIPPISIRILFLVVPLVLIFRQMIHSSER
jgi:hypothetical protein